MPHCYVKFEIASPAQMDRLVYLVDELRVDKASGQFRADDIWKALFLPEELQSFWWPSDDERAIWMQKLLATPFRQRFNDPTLKKPWDFGSMLESIREGEYSLIGVRAEDQNVGLLEFDPEGYPFGGTGGLRALIHAVGHKLVGYDDGTGFTETSETS